MCKRCKIYFVNKFQYKIACEQHKKLQKTTIVNLKVVTFQTKFFTCEFEVINKKL
jgi:hypothetical protein